jgi:glycosyltransferase involved in cell wall biosynthesis
VPEEELPALYSAAAVFCFPSLYEGFGLPVIEAMACGTPVVCGNTSSLPEVAGEAAVLVEPTNVEAIAGGLKELLADEGRRLALAAAGLARARNFTWRRTAEMTVQVYQRVAR